MLRTQGAPHIWRTQVELDQSYSRVGVQSIVLKDVCNAGLRHKVSDGKLPNGRKSRKEGFAGEVCTKRVIAESENFRLGTKGMRFIVFLE